MSCSALTSCHGKNHLKYLLIREFLRSVLLSVCRQSDNRAMASLMESARSLLASASDYYHDDYCCPPVVDPYTWIALLTGIALATWFLQMTIVNTMFSKRRKKRSFDDDGWILNLVEDWQNETQAENNQDWSTPFPLKSHGD